MTIIEDELGRNFMVRLAKAGRGKSTLSAKAEDLSSKVKLLLAERTS